MIEGLTPRQPIGVALTCGIKKDGDPKGFPTGTDRFYLVNVKEEGGIKKPHAAFAAFNNLAHPALLQEMNRDGTRNEHYSPAKHARELAMRQTIRGNIVHASAAECWSFGLRAQQIAGTPNHPNKRPSCSGDGRKAERFMGPGPDAFKTIDCPNERCPFRQKDGNKPAPCKPSAHLLFRIRWPEGNPLPTMLAKLSTGSWNSTANLDGFFTYLDNCARELGLTNYRLFGFPFVLNLVKQTKPSEKSSFPVITVTPEMDPLDFFQEQRERIRALGDVPYITVNTPEVRRLIDHDAYTAELPGAK